MPIYTCYNSWHRFTFTIYSFIEIIINLKFVETSLPGYPLTIYAILKLVLQLRPFCSWAKLGGTKFSNFAILHSKKGIEIIFFFFQFEGKRFEGIVKKRAFTLSLATFHPQNLSSARCWANVARMLRIIYDKSGGGRAVISQDFRNVGPIYRA